MSEQLPLDEAVAQFKDNEERFDLFINNAVGYLTREGVSVESIQAFLARLEEEVTGYANLEPRVDTLEAEMTTAEADIDTLEGKVDPLFVQIEVTETGDDKGVVFKEQLSVGQPQAGREAVVGEGDSYPITKAWHVDTANIVGLNVVSATDVTDIFQSDSASTAGLFGSNASGKTLLVMGENGNFGGVKVKMATAGTVEPANVLAEYLKDNTPSWSPVLYMATDAEFPYDQKANVIGSCSSCSEQWRFSLDPDDLPTVWDEVTLNINGVDYTGHFARIRTIGAITLDPVIEQLKLHTNRWECNADGNTEYFGRARYPKDLTLRKYTNADKTPSDENISVASGVTMLATDNEFLSTATDGNIYEFIVPNGLDTSIPITVEKRFYPNAATAGDIKYDCDVYKVKEGDTLDGTIAASATLSNLISVDDQQNELIKTTFKFFIPDLVPGDMVVMSISRDGPDATDTFNASIVDVSGRAVGYFWRP